MADRFEEDRRTSRTGALSATVLAVLLVVLLACLFGTGFLYMQARGQVSDLASRAPLRETVVIRTDTPTVVRRVQALAKLETSRYTLEKILDAERTRQGVPTWLAGEKLVFVAHGEVVAGLDLSKLSEDDVQVVGDTLTITLPEPEILYSRLDNENSYVYDRDEGLFSEADKDLEGHVRATAEQQLRESALEDGILDEARANGEQSLEALLGSMGFSEVEFREAATR